MKVIDLLESLSDLSYEKILKFETNKNKIYNIYKLECNNSIIIFYANKYNIKCINNNTVISILNKNQYVDYQLYVKINKMSYPIFGFKIKNNFIILK